MQDRSGVELADIEEAREEARRRAFLLLGEGYRKGQDRRGWKIRVRDEAGRVVFTLTLADATASDPILLRGGF